MAPEANCSALCVTTKCFDTLVVVEIGGREASRGFELAADLAWGGGVGKDFGASEVEPPALWPDFAGYGEKGGVSVSNRGRFRADPVTRGVEFRESACPLDSPVCGASKRDPPALRGVNLAGRDEPDGDSPGTMISAIACGWVLSSLESRLLCRVRLSVLLCNIVLSWRTAFARFNAPLLEEEIGGSGICSAFRAVSVSIVSPS